MSSRLLSMKFMQRGIANSSTASSPTTPHAEDTARASKRRKSEGPLSPALNRGQASGDAKLDEKAVQAAIADEERKRQAAIAKQAAELGDTHWVLDFPAASPASTARKTKAPLMVVQVGFAQIDTADKGDDEVYAGPSPGGAHIRRFNMKPKKSTQDTKMESEQDVDVESGSGSEDSDDSESDNSSTPYTAGGNNTRGRQSSSQDSKRKRGRSETSARRNSERTKALEFSAKRRKKNVKLNMPLSISSANPPAPSPSSKRRSSGKGGR
ncbi:hypothetical protein MCOR27_009695 [Pyricularia oryzae]|uniref:Uncharacterized protein n=2 Tax=Pyricularia TaxID=48558 RepID=A0ABQ8N9S9_PYRGI|nr:hypothetical protein MCOR01_002456 [Pyricularia oryzae]KAI6293615.1 hypothetical protein MCOR33_009028 [Pyricularia grisea]KAH9428938.1 hypothetical protein MCOR02_010359 [Pyricularia oryzae]KAI6259140.1 hypothetical protein MCOR19_004535 [Pyricularia oryzae]KAI6269550.1 hypothetical protein MCOR27_009695 [Pyricularia oryzae]